MRQPLPVMIPAIPHMLFFRFQIGSVVETVTQLLRAGQAFRSRSLRKLAEQSSVELPELVTPSR
jgi:hypothetical protein